MQKDSLGTCSTIFLLPAVGLKREIVRKYGFIAAYLDDKNHEVHHKNAIYILYHPVKMDDFQSFLRGEYIRTPLLIEDYDYAEGYVVTVYKLPLDFMGDYELFLQGKYSKFSEKYKSKFPKITDVVYDGIPTTDISIAHRIFNRTPELKALWEDMIGVVLSDDAEYWSIPDIGGTELLDINKFYKK